MDMVVQKLTAHDLPLLSELIDVYETVFEMQNFQKPEAAHLQTLLEEKTIIFFVAIANHQVIGGLTAHVLPSTYSASSLVYLFDLAVQTVHQRKGIGRKLVAALREYCTDCGYMEVFVQADLEDQHALDFYQAIGGTPENVIHFTYALQNPK